MKVLVTGACGFIGTNLCGRLLEDGNEIIGLDNFSGSYTKKAYKSNCEVFAHPKARLVKGDILDGKFLFSLSKHRITHIVHLAAKTNVRKSMENPQQYFLTNMIGSLNVL